MRRQQKTPKQSDPHPLSSDTGTNSASGLVPTLEHRRFSEFCDACRRYQYIGLCYGSPGVGKTLSARSYSHWEKVNEANPLEAGPTGAAILDTVFYTPSVVNAPKVIEADLKRSRGTLRSLAKRPLQLEKEERLASIRRRDEDYDRQFWKNAVGRPGLPELQPRYEDVAREYTARELQIRDPTTLVIVDEADRLRMASLEQIRATFDAGEIGMVLIGMPGWRNAWPGIRSSIPASASCMSSGL